MLVYVAVILAGALGNEARFEGQQAAVEVNIESSLYTYQVTNLSSEPIVAFEMPEHVSYNFKAPEGWEVVLKPISIRSSN